MILEESHDFILRGKSGWAVIKKRNLGWLVGYMVKGTKKYAYVINVETESEDTNSFSKSRKEITKKIFKELSLM